MRISAREACVKPDSPTGSDIKKITCANGWILVPHSLDGLHIMLINEIIIINFSEWIEFNFDSALNTIEFSIRVTFCYFFV